MGNPVGSHSTPPEILRQLQSLIPSHTKPDGKPNVRRLAEAMGCERSTVLRYLRRLDDEPAKPVEFPSFVTEGDEDEDISEILTRFRKAHERKQKAIEARAWFPIKVNEDKPYGILWFGDPHLGTHCNWPLLERHIAVARQDGVYSGNIGDTTDNWPWTGRLARLWAEADISHKTEKRLATWFMMEAGIKWLLWLGGNHDEWNGGTEFYKMLGAHQIPVIDWRAQFTLVHKSGTETRMDAAHGRKGSSIYNPTHGTLRDAKFGEEAAVWITGHIHSYGLFHIEFPEKKTVAWLAQIAGYKMGDRYALVNGFAQSNHGAAVLSIVNPETGKVQCFGDPEEGAEFLRWLRR
jgi:hypothetical protein